MTATKPHNKPVGERDLGEVSTEAVLIIPVVLLLILAIVQTATGWFARNALDGAAEDALRAAQQSESPDTAARDSVNTNAAFIRRVTVTVVPSERSDRVTVTVTGDVNGAFPGMSWRIAGHATGPLERFRPQGDPA